PWLRDPPWLSWPLPPAGAADPGAARDRRPHGSARRRGPAPRGRDGVREAAPRPPPVLSTRRRALAAVPGLRAPPGRAGIPADRRRPPFARRSQDLRRRRLRDAG